jgi:hypothetical protein
VVGGGQSGDGGLGHGQAVEPVLAIEAFFDAALERIADPSVPDGCLLAQSAAQAPTLNAESRAHLQALLGRQHARVRAALSTSGLDGQELTDLTTCVVAVNQSLAVLSRAGTPPADLRAVTRIACTSVALTCGPEANAGR